MSKKQQENHEEVSKSVEEVGSDKPKIAFFITPVAQPNSDIRRATDGVIDAVLKPVLERHGFDLIAPHRVSVPGSITKQVIRDILRADLVIANLTGLNANVMYELAVRHAKRLPVITIAQKGTDLPFDIAAERTIFYANDMNGVIELKEELDQFIPLAMNDPSPDNPIYSGLQSLLIHQETAKEEDNVQSYILQQLEEVNETIKLLTGRQSSNSSVSDNRTYRYYITSSAVEMVQRKRRPITDIILSMVKDDLGITNAEMTERKVTIDITKVIIEFSLSPLVQTQIMRGLFQHQGVPIDTITIT